MTVNESKNLKKGTRVCWRGDAADSGIITETSWDAVTIAWNNGQVASVHHGDARNSARADKGAYCVKREALSPDRIHLSETALSAGKVAPPHRHQRPHLDLDPHRVRRARSMIAAASASEPIEERGLSTR